MEDQSKYRLCVDEQLDLIRQIYSKLKPKNIFPFNEVIRLIESNLLKINDKIKNEGYLKPAREDSDIKKCLILLGHSKNYKN